MRVNATKDLQLKIIKGVLVLNGCIGIVGLLLAKPPLPFLVGLLLGTIISILNFRLTALTLEKGLNMSPRRAEAYVASRYMIRYFIIGAVFYISIKADYIHLLGTVIGIITLKFVILYREIFGNKQFIQKIFRRREVE